MGQEQKLDIIGEGFFNGGFLYVDTGGTIYELNSAHSLLPNSPVVNFRTANSSQFYLPFTGEKIPRLYKSFVDRFVEQHPEQELVDLIREDFSNKGENEKKIDIIAKVTNVSTSKDTYDVLFLDDHFKVYELSGSRDIATPWNDHKFYNNSSYFEELWEPLTRDIYSLFFGNFDREYKRAEHFLSQLIKPLKETSIPKKIQRQLDKIPVKPDDVNLRTGENIHIIGDVPFASDSIYLDSYYDLYFEEDRDSPYLVSRPYSNFINLYKMVKDKETQLGFFFKSELKDDRNIRLDFMEKHNIDETYVKKLLQRTDIDNKVNHYLGTL
ncbi:MAG: hypothetical protein ACQESE_05060 [Nanobdellota archaeon]